MDTDSSIIHGRRNRLLCFKIFDQVRTRASIVWWILSWDAVRLTRGIALSLVLLRLPIRYLFSGRFRYDQHFQGVSSRREALDRKRSPFFWTHGVIKFAFPTFMDVVHFDNIGNIPVIMAHNTKSCRNVTRVAAVNYAKFRKMISTLRGGDGSRHTLSIR